MNDLFNLILPLSGGILLGFIFFGGLWLTVSKSIMAKNPAIWFFVSMVLRAGIVLIGFYFIGGDQLESFLACLVGFVIARLIMTQKINRIRESPTLKKSE